MLLLMRDLQLHSDRRKTGTSSSAWFVCSFGVRIFMATQVDNMMFPITEEALETVVKAYGDVVQRAIYERLGVWQVGRLLTEILPQLCFLRRLYSMPRLRVPIQLNKHWRDMPFTRADTIKYVRAEWHRCVRLCSCECLARPNMHCHLPKRPLPCQNIKCQNKKQPAFVLWV